MPFPARVEVRNCWTGAQSFRPGVQNSKLGVLFFIHGAPNSRQRVNSFQGRSKILRTSRQLGYCLTDEYHEKLPFRVLTALFNFLIGCLVVVGLRKIGFGFHFRVFEGSRKQLSCSMLYSLFGKGICRGWNGSLHPLRDESVQEGVVLGYFLAQLATPCM